MVWVETGGEVNMEIEDRERRKTGVEAGEGHLSRVREDWDTFRYTVYVYTGKLPQGLFKKLDRLTAKDVRVKFRILLEQRGRGRQKKRQVVEAPFVATLTRIFIYRPNDKGRFVRRGVRFQFRIPARVAEAVEQVLGWDQSNWPVKLFFEHDDRLDEEFLVCEVRLPKNGKTG